MSGSPICVLAMLSTKSQRAGAIATTARMAHERARLVRLVNRLIGFNRIPPAGAALRVI